MDLCNTRCFHLFDGRPVEVKTKNKGCAKDVISDHYYQLQFTMFCAESDSMIIIVYLLDKQFYVLELFRDNYFIDVCLPLLDFAFYTNLANIEVSALTGLSNIHQLNEQINQRALMNDVRNKRKPIKRNYRCNDVTGDYLKYIDKATIESQRFFNKEMVNKISEFTIWFTSNSIYKTIQRKNDILMNYS